MTGAPWGARFRSCGRMVPDFEVRREPFWRRSGRLPPVREARFRGPPGRRDPDSQEDGRTRRRDPDSPEGSGLARAIRTRGGDPTPTYSRCIPLDRRAVPFVLGGGGVPILYRRPITQMCVGPAHTHGPSKSRLSSRSRLFGASHEHRTRVPRVAPSSLVEAEATFRTRKTGAKTLFSTAWWVFGAPFGPPFSLFSTRFRGFLGPVFFEDF